MPSPARPVGRICHEWDHNAHACKTTIDVQQVSGTRGLHYISKLAVDADGAPRAYHPLDIRKPDNSANAFDWLANISVADLHGIQGQDGVGPAAGFYISATTVHDARYPGNDTRRYVDASLIPYIVLPRATFPTTAGTVQDGCVAYVVDVRTGGTSGAIFADVGHAVGEASIALALCLGLQPFSRTYYPKVVGFDGLRFFYLVFPTVTVPPPWDVTQIQQIANREFLRWGGEAQLRALVPDLPPLKPPKKASALRRTRSRDREASTTGRST